MEENGTAANLREHRSAPLDPEYIEEHTKIKFVGFVVDRGRRKETLVHPLLEDNSRLYAAAGERLDDLFIAHHGRNPNLISVEWRREERREYPLGQLVVINRGLGVGRDGQWSDTYLNPGAALFNEGDRKMGVSERLIGLHGGLFTLILDGLQRAGGEKK